MLFYSKEKDTINPVKNISKNKKCFDIIKQFDIRLTEREIFRIIGCLGLSPYNIEIQQRDNHYDVKMSFEDENTFNEVVDCFNSKIPYIMNIISNLSPFFLSKKVNEEKEINVDEGDNNEEEKKKNKQKRERKKKARNLNVNNILEKLNEIEVEDSEEKKGLKKKRLSDSQDNNKRK
jgi:hypothetical protein